MILRQPAPAGNPDIYRGWLGNVRTENHRTVVSFFAPTCQTRSTISGITLMQAARAYSCSYNPQLPATRSSPI